jgi:uncharacterized protein (TIGR03790 family)
MTKLLCRCIAVGSLWTATLPSTHAADPSLAEATVVIYNKAIPEAAALAKFYAQQRGIARDHLVELDCSVEEEISREEYDTTIATPLRQIFKDRHWWTIRQTADNEEAVANSSIHFVALIRGMPLKIRPRPTPYPGDDPSAGPVASRNEASVDSEISILSSFFKHISGAVPNPYFQSFRGIGQFEGATLLLVCRLDAPAAPTVRRMITDSVAAEKNGLWGRAYVDGSHNTAPGYQMGDKWLADVTDQLHKAGVPVVYDDSPATFPEGYPMTDCGLYYGWYAGQITGPFTRPDFRFIQGTIAVHIHSYSAATLRDPNANWVAPLIARGAAASLGNVYEPYLQLTAHLDIFNDRLLHGFTLAESAYMSLPGLSWMSVVVGDPLYRPFAWWSQIDAPRDLSKGAPQWKMYHDFAVKNRSLPAPQYRLLARQIASRARNGPMLEDLGAIEANEGNLALATSYFQQARACYGKRDDILRVVLEEADCLIKQDKRNRALELVRSVLRIVSDAPAVPLLRKIEQDITGPPPSPATP